MVLPTPTHRLSPAPHRLAKAMRKQLANPRAANLRFGTVTKAAASGSATCTVAISGAPVSLPCAFPAAYTPVAGDSVLVAQVGSNSRARSSWVVLSKLYVP